MMRTMCLVCGRWIDPGEHEEWCPRHPDRVDDIRDGDTGLPIKKSSP